MSSPLLMAKALLVAVMSLTLITSACGFSGHKPSTEATVGVRAAGCSLIDNFGTGIAVAPRLIATSAHTVAGATVVTVVDQTQVEHEATVVGFDPRQDVAILQIADPIPHSALGEIGRGDSGVLATWNPDEGFETLDVSILRLLRVTIEDIYVEDLTERLAFEIEASVVHGNSGGPVFNSEGTVAGIIYATSRERDDIAFALRSAEIAELLEATDGLAIDNGRCI